MRCNVFKHKREIEMVCFSSLLSILNGIQKKTGTLKNVSELFSSVKFVFCKKTMHIAQNQAEMYFKSNIH